MNPSPGPPQQPASDKLSWSKRHFYLSTTLAVLGAVALGALTYFLYLLELGYFGKFTGGGVLAIIAYLIDSVIDFRKTRAKRLAALTPAASAAARPSLPSQTPPP